MSATSTNIETLAETQLTALSIIEADTQLTSHSIIEEKSSSTESTNSNTTQPSICEFIYLDSWYHF
jgi:hypothetical protein